MKENKTMDYIKVNQKKVLTMINSFWDRDTLFLIEVIDLATMLLKYRINKK